MTIKEVLVKVAKGEQLTDDEKILVGKYDPESNEGRIPKSRLDEEIAKVKTEKERADRLETSLTELQSKVEGLENAGKTAEEKAKLESEKELTKLKSQIATLTKDRDDAISKASKMQFDGQVSSLAAKHGFTDAAYLGFLVNQNAVDLNDETAASSFVKGLEKTAPGHFKSAAKPGAGTGAGSSENPASANAKQRLAVLEAKPELSSRELGEVIELQTQLRAESAKQNGTSGSQGNNNATGAAEAGAGSN